MASAEAPGVGDIDGPYLIVTAPMAGDSADAGEEYTVEVSYGRPKCGCEVVLDRRWRVVPCGD